MWKHLKLGNMYYNAKEKEKGVECGRNSRKSGIERLGYKFSSIPWVNELSLLAHL